MKPLMTLALAIAMPVVMAGCGGSGSSTTVLRGQLVLTDNGDFENPNFIKGSGQCFGTGGYDDIAQGASVTVENASGTVIATGSLGVGHPRVLGCDFAFSVPKVPTSKFYKVEVSHRGFITVPQAEAGSIGMSLGD